MELDRQQLQAAHQLGEAILRFVKAVGVPIQFQVATSTRSPAESGTNKSEHRLLRVSEAAQILSLSRSKIYGLMDSGRLPSVKLDSARRIRLSEVMKLLDGIE